MPDDPHQHPEPLPDHLPWWVGEEPDLSPEELELLFRLHDERGRREDAERAKGGSEKKPLPPPS